MIGLLLICAAHAGGVAEGVEAYDAGQLDAAVEAWDAPRSEGRGTSAVAAYNIGTAYLRKGDAPRSIVHLRAAARLRPRDGDIQHNLAVARAMLGAVPPAVGLPDTWMSVVTPGELGLLGLLLAALGSVAIGAHRVGRGPGRGTGAALLLGGLVVGGAAVRGATLLQQHPVAVVTEPEAVLRDGPAVDAGEHHRLPAGSEVRVERSYQGFYLIEDSRGRRGWLAAGAADLGW